MENKHKDLSHYSCTARTFERQTEYLPKNKVQHNKHVTSCCCLQFFFLISSLCHSNTHTGTIMHTDASEEQQKRETQHVFLPLLLFFFCPFITLKQHKQTNLFRLQFTFIKNGCIFMLKLLHGYSFEH